MYSANGEQLWDSVTGVAPPGTVSDIPPPPPAVGEAKSGEIPAPALVSEATPVADEAPVEPLEQLAPEEPAAPAVPEAAPVADEAPVEPLEQLAPEEPVAPAVPDLTPAADEAPVEPLEQLAPEEPVAPEVPTAPAVPELAPSLDEPPVEPLEQLAPEPVAPVVRSPLQYPSLTVRSKEQQGGKSCFWNGAKSMHWLKSEILKLEEAKTQPALQEAQWPWLSLQSYQDEAILVVGSITTFHSCS